MLCDGHGDVLLIMTKSCGQSLLVYRREVVIYKFFMYALGEGLGQVSLMFEDALDGPELALALEMPTGLLVCSSIYL